MRGSARGRDRRRSASHANPVLCFAPPNGFVHRAQRYEQILQAPEKGVGSRWRQKVRSRSGATNPSRWSKLPHASHALLTPHLTPQGFLTPLQRDACTVRSRNASDRRAAHATFGEARLEVFDFHLQGFGRLQLAGRLVVFVLELSHRFLHDARCELRRCAQPRGSHRPRSHLGLLRGRRRLS